MTTQLQTRVSSTEPLRRTFIRDGVAGNYEVIFEMVRVVRDSVNYDLGIEAVAKDILIKKHLNDYSSVQSKLRAVFDYVKDNVVYIKDRAGRIESLKSARQTLADGYGDCDDHTNTNATLLGCLGFEDVRIAMARYTPEAGSFQHVYCVAYEDGKRYVLDTTLPNGNFNQEAPATEIKEISIFDSVEGLDGASGLYTNVRYHAKKFARAAVKVVPTATAFLPLGFISGNALATGANLIQNSANSPLSYNATATRVNEALDSIIVQLLYSRIALDLAKAQALQNVAQLSAIENVDVSPADFLTIKTSVKQRLDFINNFESYARDNNIKVVYLNANLMLLAGLGAAGFGGYALYKTWANKRGY